MSYTNLKIQNFAHRANGEKDTDMEEQQEEKGKLCCDSICIPRFIMKAQGLRFGIVIYLQTGLRVYL
jgi:hypothetical protein